MSSEVMIKSKEPCERAELVFEKPLSGEYEEVLFGSAIGNTLWVLFSDQHDIGQWIGKFDCGLYGGNKVTKCAEPDKFFICAGGWFYFVDATTRELLEEPYCGQNIHDAVFDPTSGCVLVADWSTISLIKSKTKVWSVAVGTDGIRNLKLEGDILRGIAEFDYNGTEREFTLNLVTKKLEAGRRTGADAPEHKSKPWWKIW